MAAIETQRQIRPERFGRYILLEKIGQGGMAEVFRAVASGAGGFRRVLVLKRILPEMSRDERFVQMFVDEAKICALISHPNIVQVFEFGKIDDSHFLAMEYVHGRNLSTVMAKLAEQGQLPPPDIMAEIVRQAALGLHHAHSMTAPDGSSLGIIHRDVTPANIMLGFSGAVKVLDFGIARAAEEVKETRTQAGAVKGKVAYLAPEQINRQPVDHRADLFALGVVLHECLTGKRLFKADNPLAAMKAILEMPIPPPSRMNPSVSPKLDRVVARALQRKPELRYPNGKALAMDLEAVLVEQRFFSQRLPNFLKELFKDEVTDSKDRILPAELAALEALPEEPEIELHLAGVEVMAEVSAPAEKQPAAPTRAPFLAPPSRPPRIPTLPPPPPAVATGSASLPGAEISSWPSTRTLEKLQAWLAVGKRKLWAGGALAGVLLTLVFIAISESKAPPSPAGHPTAAGASASHGQHAGPGHLAMPTEPSRTTVRISVDSSPQGATVTGADGRTLGTTPVTLTFPADSTPLSLSFALAGYAAEQVTVIPDLDKPVFARLREIPRAKVHAPELLHRTPAPAGRGTTGVKADNLTTTTPEKRLLPRDPFAR